MKLKLAQTNTIDLLFELVKTSFKLRYQNSILGILWVLIKPYSTFIVLYLIFSNVIRQDIKNYQLYLLLGIIMYTYFNELIVLGQMALLERAHIILKVNFPRQIAIISALISALINLSLNTIFVLFIMLINGITLTINGILYLGLISLVLFIFCLALAFFTSILTIKFRDLKNIFELGLFLLYWATPVVLDFSLLNGTIGSLVGANPLGILINQVRAGFGINSEMNPGIVWLYLFLSIIFLIIGWYYFKNKIKEIAEYF